MPELIDLSMPLSAESIPVPGHPSPTIEPLQSLEQDGVRNSVLTMSLHTATHVDAPSHFIDDGVTIDQVPLETFHGKGLLVDVTAVARPDTAITAQQVLDGGFDGDAANGSIVLLHSGWTDQTWKRETLYADNPYLGDDAAQLVAQAKPLGLGLDFAVDRRRPWPNHHLLLGAGIVLIENLMGLGRLSGAEFDVSAFPLLVMGGNGAPARVVAAVRA